MYNFPKELLITDNLAQLFVDHDSSLFHAMTTINAAPSHNLPAGMSLIIGDNGELAGVVSDGDVRRALLNAQSVEVGVEEVMTKQPIVIPHDTAYDDVLKGVREQLKGRNSAIRYAVVVDDAQKPVALFNVARMTEDLSLGRNKVAVIGMGYVGLTLSLALAQAGVSVVGWDISDRIRDMLNRGESHIFELGLDSLLTAQLERKRFHVASDYSELADCGAYIVAVNTPVSDGVPNLDYVKAAMTDLCTVLKPGALVILRSTIAVGTCRTVVKPIIEENTAYKVGGDIGLAFAPERTVQGKALEELRTLPQIVAGINPWSQDAAAQFFSRLGTPIVKVSSLEEAEIIKLVNNSFRDVSFAFANEIARLCEQFNINASKMIQAANSGYPRNPVALPSPGVGGACLTKDPYILAKAHTGSIGTLSQLGREVNEDIVYRVHDRLVAALEENGKALEDCKVFVLGLAFKGVPETNDMRGSAAITLIEELTPRVREIYGYDSVVSQDEAKNAGVVWSEIEAGFDDADAVLVMNNHHDFRSLNLYALLARANAGTVLFDGWGLYNDSEVEAIDGLRYMTMGYLTPAQV